MEYIISILLSLVSGLLVFIIKGLLKENHKLRESEKNEAKKRENAIGDALLCLLRVTLIEYHDKYVVDGHIPSYAYDNWTKMYDAYIALGGNGMIVGMNEDIKELTII